MTTITIDRVEFANALYEALTAGEVMNERVLTWNRETGEFWSGSSLTPLSDGEIVIIDDIHEIMPFDAEVDGPDDFVDGFDDLWDGIRYTIDEALIEEEDEEW